MAKIKVYKIRLNTEDAKTGIEPKECRDRRAEKGIEYSQLSIDAWNAAVEHTTETILASYSDELRDAVEACRPTLPKKRKDACCNRCGGSGVREDKEKWVVLEEHADKPGGKRCFKCNGSGIEPSMEPVFFRRRVFDSFRNATLEQVRSWANKFYNDRHNAYRYILMDVVMAIREGERLGHNTLSAVFKLPH